MFPCQYSAYTPTGREIAQMATTLTKRVGIALAGHAGRYEIPAWQSLDRISGVRSLATTTVKAAKAGTRGGAPVVKTKESHRALTVNVGKTAGRNSAGRITSYHRGGGAKRLHRRIDIKRDTSSIGVVERIEYDPNRSSRIALVRWVEGGRYSAPKFKEPKEPLHQYGTAEPVATTTQGKYTLSSMSRNVDQRTVAYCSPVKATSLVVGNPASTASLNGTSIQRTSVRDIFLTAFSRNRKARGESIPSESCSALPRIAVVGAQPKFFAPQSREEAEGKTEFAISEIKKYDKQSSTWDNRLKRKAAIPWLSCTL